MHSLHAYGITPALCAHALPHAAYPSYVSRYAAQGESRSGGGAGATAANTTRLDYYRVAGGGHTLPGAPLVWAGLGHTSSYDGFGAIMRSWGHAADGDGDVGGGDVDGGGGSAPDLPMVAALVLGALALFGAAVGGGACVRAGWRRAQWRKREHRAPPRPSCAMRGSVVVVSACDVALGLAAAPLASTLAPVLVLVEKGVGDG